MSSPLWSFYRWSTVHVSYPEWIFFLWFATATAFLTMALTIVRVKLWRAWPALLASGLLEVIAFVGLQHQTSPRYFYLWWGHAGAQAVLRIAALGDVLRALPGGSQMPAWLKASISICALVAAAVVSITMLQHLPGQLVVRMHRVDAAVKFSWAALTVVLLYGVKYSGFRFTMTGMRIATAYICRMLAGMVSVVVYSYHPLTRFSFLFVSGVDTVAGLCFALYCIFAILRDSESLALTSPHLLPARQPEKAGQP